MMTKTKLIAAFFAATTLVCCTVDKAKLSGRWQATAFYENGQSLNVPLDSVRLELTQENRYDFQSLGFYRESGPYSISERYLFLTDTTADPIGDHTLKILYLSDDSLKVRMRSTGGNEQVLFFVRIP